MTQQAKTWEPKEIPEHEYNEAKKQVEDNIVVARVGLLLRHSFFGNMATRLNIENADSWCPTAATDGRNLYYNTAFFREMNVSEIEFVIGHEILHCAFDHMTRTEKRDKQLFNIACDYLVNNCLIKNNIGSIPSFIDCYHDQKYDGWTAEEVYDDLLKNAEKVKMLASLLDEHMDLEDNQGDQNRPSYSEEEIQKIKDDIRESMISSAQSASGDVPVEIQRLVKDLTEPKMDWREIIRQQIQSTVKNDYSFVRPSRKSMSSGVVLPGIINDTEIDICVCIDTSGSIRDEQIRDFLSEVKGITSQYQNYKINLWSFDTRVHNHQEFSSSDIADIDDYVPHGGGGTDFNVNWKFMKEKGIVPEKFIIFTDMYPWGSFGEEDYCDTIFINHGRPGFEAPFGITVEYKN